MDVDFFWVARKPDTDNINDCMFTSLHKIVVEGISIPGILRLLYFLTFLFETFRNMGYESINMYGHYLALVIVVKGCRTEYHPFISRVF